MSPKWHFVFEKMRAVCGAGVNWFDNFEKNVIQDVLLKASLRSPIESIDAEQPKVLVGAQ